MRITLLKTRYKTYEIGFYVWGIEWIIHNKRPKGYPVPLETSTYKPVIKFKCLIECRCPRLTRNYE